ncbi:MFS transporter [Duganella sp. FT92W]|uniref:MFS transporter n=1 Tax=Pseudoduganella rivuli TaxID=2666085 RepID=A0A7X2III1_9BURK|nr:MFS transporter [Pseudoduganella rivuli]MRV70435.1 MFS transporter [Pseudoduganella rivuli]
MKIVTAQEYSSGQAGAALLTGSAALLILGLQPILLGELVAGGAASMEGVGVVAMAEIMALGLGVALGDCLLPLTRYRLVTVLAALSAAGFDIGSCGAHGDIELAVWRAAAGLVEGIQVWAATCVIVRSAKPDRLVAVFMVVQTASQSAAAAWLAWGVIPHGGWQAGFQALALLAMLAVLCAPCLPYALRPLPAPASGKFSWSVQAVLPLATAFLQMSAIGALWAYLEPLGLAAGLNAQATQSVVSMALLTQVLGGVAAVVLIRRLAVVRTLGAGIALLAAVSGAIGLLPAGQSTAFVLLCAVFGFVWLFLMPFHVALAFRADPGGRVAMLVPAAQLLGCAIGPLVASLLIHGEDAAPVPPVSASFAVAALVTVLLCRAGHAGRSK